MIRQVLNCLNQGEYIRLELSLIHILIMFVSDYRLSSEQDIYNHYVAATRAKSKLIMVYINGDWNAKQFAKNINRILAESNLKMSDVATVVNCL